MKPAYRSIASSLFIMPWQKRIHVLADLAVLSIAFWVAYLVRFEFAIPAREIPSFYHQLPLTVLLQLLVLASVDSYVLIWRYIGLNDLRRFLTAALVSGALLLALRVFLPESAAIWRVPLSVALIDIILGFGGLVLVRVLRRWVYERFNQPVAQSLSPSHSPSVRKPALLIGAGRAGKFAADALRQGPDQGLEIVGFIDDDRQKRGAVVAGLKVLGSMEDLPRLVKEYNVDHVIITIARASRAEIRSIVTLCEKVPVPARIIPTMQELLCGRVEINWIREIQIEDLLGRSPVQLEASEAEQFIAGRVVMVTGAGGSIGSELCRQVIRFNPSNLILLERSEPALFSIESELRQRFPTRRVTAMLADITDSNRLAEIFSAWKPSVVIHAAAHKHVPMLESHPAEGIANNVFGTLRLATAAAHHGVETFVLISSDKAVRPTSVMGTTKRVAELIIQGLNQRYNTRFVAVRFGNVIGSTGSVVPIFKAQIKRGGPVTVTHPDMTRFFMTIPEAAQLVIDAASIGQGGEVFILDMGEPVRILDLAKDLIRLSGLIPFEDIDIQFTGKRPGEKLYEELDLDGERLDATRHPKVFIGNIVPEPLERVEAIVQRLAVGLETRDPDTLKAILMEAVPEATLEIRTTRKEQVAERSTSLSATA